MQTLNQPTLLLKPFAESGDKNTIPVTNTDVSEPQRADLTNGFPEVTSLDPDDGGIPAERKDFNALGYLTTSYDYFYQAGGTFTYNATVATAIGGYPLNARLWYTDSDGISMILRSTIGNNTNNFLTDPSVIGQVGDTSKPWVIENFMGIRGQYNLFDTKWSDYELDDMNWLNANTFSWQSGSVYSNAYEHLVDDIDGISSSSETVGSYTITYYQATDGHKIVLADQESAVAAIYGESGIAWYYVLDTTNSRFKLPRTKFNFVGLRDNVGNYVAESLPDYVALSGYNGRAGQFRQKSVAYNYTSDLYQNDISDSTSSSTNYGTQVDVLNYRPVQQRATQMYLYFYVGQFSQSANEQTAGLNATLFNGKVDLDLENIPSVSKQKIISWGMPDYSAGESITLATDSPYTVQKDGFIVACDVSGGTGTCYLKINDTNVGKSDVTNYYIYRINAVYPVNKNDILSTEKNINNGTLTFYPCKGL